MYVVTLVSLVIELACRKQATSATFHRHFSLVSEFHLQRPPRCSSLLSDLTSFTVVALMSGWDPVKWKKCRMSVSLTLKIIHFWFLFSLAIFPFQITDLCTQLLEAQIIREMMTPNWLVAHGNNVSFFYRSTPFQIPWTASQTMADGWWRRSHEFDAWLTPSPSLGTQLAVMSLSAFLVRKRPCGWREANVWPLPAGWMWTRSLWAVTLSTDWLYSWRHGRSLGVVHCAVNRAWTMETARWSTGVFPSLRRW